MIDANMPMLMAYDEIYPVPFFPLDGSEPAQADMDKMNAAFELAAQIGCSRPPTTEGLSDEYGTWLKRHGFEGDEPVDELLCGAYDLKPHQKEWLEDFAAIYHEAEEHEDFALQVTPPAPPAPAPAKRETKPIHDPP